MRLSLEIIKAKLEEEEVLYAKFGRKQALCEGLRFWEEEEKEIDSESIYILSGKSFLRCIRNGILLPSQLVCVSPDSSVKSIRDRFQKFSEDGSILVVSDCRSAESWFNQIQKIFVHYRRLYGNLAVALLREQNLEEILDICEEIMGNPVGLFDSSLRLLGQSHALTEDSGINRFWREAYTQRYVGADLLNLLKERNLLATVNKARSAVWIDLEDDFSPYITGNIYCNDVKVGSISVFESYRPVREEDGQLLDQITPILAMRTEKEEYKYALRYSKAQQVLVDLIEGKEYSASTIRRTLQNFPCEPKEGLYFLKLEVDQKEIGNGLMGYMGTVVEKIVGRCIRIHIKDAMVFIFNRGAAADEADMRQVLEKQLQKFQVKCACGMPFYQWEDLHQQFLYASIALEYGKKVHPDRPFYSYMEYAAYHKIALCERQTDIRKLCLSSMWKVHQMDEENNSELVDSLYYYLICGKSLSAAAKILNIHKSTLSYRLLKVDEVVGLDLDDIYIRQQLIFSCEIINYLKVFG